MTEVEWLTCKNATKMLRFLHKQKQQAESWKQLLFGWLGTNTVTVSERRLSKLLVAYCFCHPRLFTDDRDRTALAVAESYVNRKATEEELVDAEGACMTWQGDIGIPSAGYWLINFCRNPYYHKTGDRSYFEQVWGFLATASAFDNPVDYFSADPPLVRDRLEMEVHFATEAERMAYLLHETIGNPFRPVSLNPSWLTSTVLALATDIYSERAFDRMPILADALQDAGCDNEDILNHCRQPGEHTRGCWVVDLVLGKE